MDLPTLTRDIPKWLPWLTAPAEAEWHDFFDTLVPDLATGGGTPWILPDLELKGQARDDAQRSEGTSTPRPDDIFASERVCESQVSAQTRSCVYVQLQFNAIYSNAKHDKILCALQSFKAYYGRL